MRTDRYPGRRGTASVLLAVSMAAGGVLLSGCGASVEGTQAGLAADAFTGAEATDPSAACARLAPETVKTLEKDGASCEQELADAGLPAAGERRGVEVAGHSAQVRYTGDTVFLARFDDGWRVTAAGCERESDDPSEPYDCDVDGG
jgi:hypothetical protein